MDRNEIGAIYDNFPPGGKNMPREQFIKEVRLLADPKSIGRDLVGYVEKKKTERMNREAIDGGLEQHG